MAQLLINKNAWHYRYWSFIRAIWGFGKLPDKTSLCPYCQTMLWLSILTFVFSPFLLTGWLLGKVMRYTYKTLETAKVHKVVDVIDKLKIGNGLNKMTESMEACPAVAALTTFFAVSILVLGFVLLLVGCAIILGTVPSIVMGIPAFLWMCICGTGTGLLYLGSGIMMAMAVIGFCLTTAMHYIIWFFTNAVMWWWVGIVVSTTLVASVVSPVVVYLFYRFWSSSLGQRLSQWTNYKFNGYKEAHRSAIERRAKIQAKIACNELSQPKKSPWTTHTFSVLGTVGNIVTMPYKAIKWSIFSKQMNWNDNAAKVMSPFAILWTMLVSFKKGVCPLVEFVDLENPTETTKNG